MITKASLVRAFSAATRARSTKRAKLEVDRLLTPKDEAETGAQVREPQDAHPVHVAEDGSRLRSLGHHVRVSSIEIGHRTLDLAASFEEVLRETVVQVACEDRVPALQHHLREIVAGEVEPEHGPHPHRQRVFPKDGEVELRLVPADPEVQQRGHVGAEQIREAVSVGGTGALHEGIAEQGEIDGRSIPHVVGVVEAVAVGPEDHVSTDLVAEDDRPMGRVAERHEVPDSTDDPEEGLRVDALPPQIVHHFSDRPSIRFGPRTRCGPDHPPVRVPKVEGEKDLDRVRREQGGSDEDDGEPEVSHRAPSPARKGRVARARRLFQRARREMIAPVREHPLLLRPSSMV
jgi:hypothetical protein